MDNESSQATQGPDRQATQVTQAEVQCRYLPLYELIMALVLVALGLISSAAFIGAYFFGRRHGIGEQALVLGVGIVATLAGLWALRGVSGTWLRLRVGQDIELHWWLRGTTTHMPKDRAQSLQLSSQVDPIRGVRSEAILLLQGNGNRVELPVLRSLLPNRRFRRQVQQLAQHLQIPIKIPAPEDLPLGFRKAFDRLRAQGLVSPVTAPAQDNIEALIDKLLLTPVDWESTGDGEYVNRLVFDGQVCEIRVNDWPEYETVYSLVVNRQVVRDLGELPGHWECGG